MDYYSSMKKNEVPIHATLQMKLKNIIPSEKRASILFNLPRGFQGEAKVETH